MIRTTEREKTIINQLRKPRTANEVIDIIFKSDWDAKLFKGWKHYVHLNKLFAPLSKNGLIKEAGTKINDRRRVEKIWVKC